MKKVLYFFAVLALLGGMTACNGSAGTDGVSSKNEVKEGDTDAQKFVKLTDQMVCIMEQEPSLEGYEALMNVSKQMMSLNLNGVNQEEMQKALSEFDSKYADEAAMEEKMAGLQEKWTKWAQEHQEEVAEIAKKAFAN